MSTQDFPARNTASESFLSQGHKSLAYYPLQTYSGAENMAFDQWLLENKIPALRMYQWRRPTVTLGYFQKSSEVNREYIVTHEGDLTRRLTGGKAVLHQHEVTYSIIAPVEWFPGPVTDSYRLIGRCLVRGLEILGIKSTLNEEKEEGSVHGNCFQVPGFFEVMAEGKKLIGSAQLRRNGMLLQHGSLILKLDDQRIRGSFNHDDGDVLKAGALSELMETVPQPAICAEALSEGFREVLGASLNKFALKPEDLKVVESLAAERYAADKWVFRR